MLRIVLPVFVNLMHDLKSLYDSPVVWVLQKAAMIFHECMCPTRWAAVGCAGSGRVACEIAPQENCGCERKM